MKGCDIDKPRNLAKSVTVEQVWKSGNRAFFLRDRRGTFPFSCGNSLDMLRITSNKKAKGMGRNWNTPRSMNGSVVLDFGGQYSPADRTPGARPATCTARSKPIKPTGGAHLPGRDIRRILFTGGPNMPSMQRTRPVCAKQVFDLGIPVLGICYGAQLMAYLLGRKVSCSSEVPRISARRQYELSFLRIPRCSRTWRESPSAG